MSIKKIHHISNIVKHPQDNIDFYAGLLGLRLIKKAVNFDAANTYHFYFGNHQADSGTITTSFPIGRDTKEGVRGGGMTDATYYLIPKGSFNFWLKRLNDFNLETSIIEKFGNKHLVFSDYLGIKNELVESDAGITNLYEYNGVTKEEAIKGFYGASLYSTNPEKTKDFFLKYLNAKLDKEDDQYYRMTYESEIASIIDIDKEVKLRGRLSKGTVDHIAFEMDTEENLIKLNARLIADGFKTSGIKDRNFFKAIYVREPGETIIEVSTEAPGFLEFGIDDQGKELFLPPHYEHLREELESTMTPIVVREVSELKKYHYEGVEEYNAFVRHQTVLARINEIAGIAKERDLTEEELSERDLLRKEYVKTIKNNVSGMTENIEYVDQFGHLQKLNKKDVN